MLAGARKWQALASCTCFDDCSRANAPHVQVSFLSLSAFLASHHPFLQGGRPAGGRRVHGQPSSSTDGAWLFRVTHFILPTSLTILVKVRMKPRHGIGCIIASDVERRNNNSLREVRHIFDLLAPQAPVVSDQFLCL